MHHLRASVLVAAVSELNSKRVKNATFKLLGAPFNERDLRTAAEAELRACAQFTQVPGERMRWSIRPNAVRNRQSFSWL